MNESNQAHNIDCVGQQIYRDSNKHTVKKRWLVTNIPFTFAQVYCIFTNDFRTKYLNYVCPF